MLLGLVFIGSFYLFLAVKVQYYKAKYQHILSDNNGQDKRKGELMKNANTIVFSFCQLR